MSLVEVSVNAIVVNILTATSATHQSPYRPRVSRTLAYLRHEDSVVAQTTDLRADNGTCSWSLD